LKCTNISGVATNKGIFLQFIFSEQGLTACLSLFWLFLFLFFSFGLGFVAAVLAPAGQFAKTLLKQLSLVVKKLQFV